jgi:hypothetical protein
LFRGRCSPCRNAFRRPSVLRDACPEVHPRSSPGLESLEAPAPASDRVLPVIASNVSRGFFGPSSTKPHDPFESPGGMSRRARRGDVCSPHSSVFNDVHPRLVRLPICAGTRKSLCSSVERLVHGETLGFGGPVAALEPVRLSKPVSGRTSDAPSPPPPSGCPFGIPSSASAKLASDASP